MPILLNTLASAEQIAETPSRRDGIPADLEDELRVYGCQLIQQAGILLKLPQVAMATAQVLFQRFWYVTSMKHFSIKDIGAGALFLASKLEESPLSIRDLVNVYDYLLQRSLHTSKHYPGPRALERKGISKPSQTSTSSIGSAVNQDSNGSHSNKRKIEDGGKGKEKEVEENESSSKKHQSSHPSSSSSSSGTKEDFSLSSSSSRVSDKSKQIPTFKYVPQSYFAQSFYDAKDALVIAEMQILKRLGFNVQVNLPYATMVNYLQLLGLTNSDDHPGVAQRAWGYLNDALQTPVYCLFPPHILACASIYLCTLERQRDSSSSTDTTSTFKPPSLPMSPAPWYVLFDATRPELRSVCAHILRLYDEESGLAARVREEWGGLAELADKKGVKEWVDRWGDKSHVVDQIR